MEVTKAIYFGTRADVLRECQGMQLPELRLVVRVIRQARLDRKVSIYAENPTEDLWDSCVNARAWYKSQAVALRKRMLRSGMIW